MSPKPIRDVMLVDRESMNFCSKGVWWRRELGVN